MDQERARELQGKLVQQAAASLVLTGSGEDVDAYEQVVALIGKAWDLPMSGTAKQLALIEQERETMQRIERGAKAEHIAPIQDVLKGWSGLESVEVIEDLFETATLLDDHAGRKALFNMAMTLVGSQSLLDWIEKTDEERMLPEWSEPSAKVAEGD